MSFLKVRSKIFHRYSVLKKIDLVSCHEMNTFSNLFLALGCTPPPECTGEFKAAWWARSPYLANSSNQEPFGLFKDLLTQVVISCCANCSLLSFDGPYNGSSDVEAVIEVNKTVDFGCPLYGSPDQTLFKGLPFMPIGNVQFYFT